ncbi:MAG: exodeoxyribonuclease VII large subunit [Chloroflexi bacterium]|nr:exodeoxyribonuclease VII large subunit [Chloroflexota bacterium]MCY3697746.1 exodeoxyribonuclease VII large subunit [Chloroflexota bacterium]
MPRRPPSGFNARRAQQRQIDWDEPVQSIRDHGPIPQSHPVGDIARHIRSKLKSDPQLNDVWIEGEVRSFNRSGAGHYYFDLADAESDAALSCAFFRNQNRGIRVEQGDQVLVHGSADVYLPRGSLQIIVDAVRPIGEGVLQAEFERLFRNLQAEGLFNPDRKRPIPSYPKRIGVVTSPSGAVWHDIQQVVARRWPLVSLLLAPCLTQGAGAADSIAAAIEELNLLTTDEPDVIIVARGGGSPEDLWAYNEESVARAIFASEIPVISAVGHETDVTISDHVADRRAPTPSAAAEIAVPDRAEEAARLAALRQQAHYAIEGRVSGQQQWLALVRDRLETSAPHPPTLRVELNRRRLDLDRALSTSLADVRTRWAAAGLRLNALNPRRTLERGFAIVSRVDGQVITSAARLGADEAIEIQFADGVVGARTASRERSGEAKQHE